MGDRVGARSPRRPRRARRVGDRALDEGQALAARSGCRGAPVAKLSRVEDLVALGQQPVGEVGADEPAPAGDQDLHQSAGPFVVEHLAELALAVVEALLPELEREQPPELPAELRLAVERRQDVLGCRSARGREQRRWRVRRRRSRAAGPRAHSTSGTGKPILSVRSRISLGHDGARRAA